MQISSLIVKKSCVVIKLDDISLKLSYETYSNHLLYVGKEISNQEFFSIKKEERISKSLSWAKKYLSKYTCSTHDFKNKLKDKGLSYLEVNDVVKKMNELNLLNDSIYIKEKVEYYNRHNYGKNLIKNKLFKSGISYSLISNINFSDEDEIIKMDRLGYLNISNNNDKDLIISGYRKYLNKGFDEEVINYYIKRKTNFDESISLYIGSLSL